MRQFQTVWIENPPCGLDECVNVKLEPGRLDTVPRHAEIHSESELMFFILFYICFPLAFVCMYKVNTMSKLYH